MTLATRVTEMLGCEHPLQLAGMGGSPSPALAIAVARAGGIGMVGTLATHLDAVPPDLVIGVNFLMPFLDRAALEEASSRSPLVELFWGEPDPGLVGTIHQGGARAAWQVGSVDEARAAADAGCDIVVAQGMEAGGHVRGTVELAVLLPDVLAAVDVPVVAAGGIGTGKAVADALLAGADAVRVGTRFLAATESVAHPAYVGALIAADPDDTEITTAFGDGWPDAPHRVLRSAVAAGEALGAAQDWSPMWPTEETPGPIEARALYAGRSVGAVRDRQPAAAIVAELMDDAEQRMRAAP